jgi:hypothetical protein
MEIKRYQKASGLDMDLGLSEGWKIADDVVKQSKSNPSCVSWLFESHGENGHVMCVLLFSHDFSIEDPQMEWHANDSIIYTLHLKHPLDW